MQAFPTPLVSAEYLLQYHQYVKIIDGSWYLPVQNRNAEEEYKSGHIPGAIRFNIEKVIDTTSNVPFTIPTQEQFEKAVSELGISNDDNIVVYDGLHVFSAGRTYFLFKYFGHKNVSCLDGGLPAWKRAEGPLSQEVPQIVPTVYKANPQANLVSSLQQVLQNISNLKEGKQGDEILDARAKARFLGDAPEPEPIPSGHMPYSKSLPYSDLLNPDGTFKPEDQIKEILTKLNIEQGKNIICTCGYGISANVIILALEKIGFQNYSLFDGSWTEYARQENVEILKGE